MNPSSKQFKHEEKQETPQMEASAHSKKFLAAAIRKKTGMPASEKPNGRDQGTQD